MPLSRLLALAAAAGPAASASAAAEIWKGGGNWGETAAAALYGSTGGDVATGGVNVLLPFVSSSFCQSATVSLCEQNSAEKPFMTETKDEKAAKAPGLLFNRDYLINATSLRQNFMPSSSCPLLHSFFH